MRKSKNFLLANYIFLDEHVCKTSRLGLLNALKEFGYSVFFYGAYIKHPEDVHQNIKVFQYKLPPISYLKLIWYLLTATFRLPVIIARYNISTLMIDPYTMFACIPVYLYRIIFRKKLTIILDFRSGIFHFRKGRLKNSLKSIYIKVVLFLAARLSDGYTFITPELRRNVAQKYNLNGKKYTHWSSGVNENFLKCDLKFNKNGSLRILYHGSLGKDRGLPELIEAMIGIKKKGIPVTLDIVGDGTIKKHLKYQIESNNLDNVRIHNTVTPEEIISYINQADIGIIPLSDTMPMRTSSPLKMVEYLSLNKVMIVTELPAFTDVINEQNKNFIFIKDNRPQNIEEGILYAYANRNQLKEWGGDGRKIVNDRFLWKHQARSVIELMDKIDNDNEISTICNNIHDKIHIAFFIVSFNATGPSKILTDLALNINKAKYKVVFIVCDNDFNNKYYQKLVGAGIPVESLDMNGYFDFFKLFKLVKVLRKYDIDILHSRLTRANVYGRLAGRLVNTPLIISNIVESQIDHFNGFHTGIAGKILYIINNMTIQFADYLIANSKNGAAEISKLWKHKRNSINMIPNGVDTELFSNTNGKSELLKNELGIDKNSYVIGSVGRLVNIKGFVSLVKAAKLVLDKKPNVTFILLGAGEQENEIREMINSLDMTDRFLLLGFQKDIVGYLAIMDLFVFTSLHEGMPNAILEAMAAKLPIVAFEISALNELIIHNKTGVLIPKRRERDLALNIINLLDDKQRRQDLGENSYNFIEKNYSLELMVKKFEEFYELKINEIKRMD